MLNSPERSTEHPALETSDVHKKFGDTVVLKGIDLRVNKGETVSITGASGSGKTTLMNIMGILEPADSGDIRIDGLPVSPSHAHHARGLRSKKLGFVFQESLLDPRRTALENVIIALKFAGVSRPQRVECAMSSLSLVNIAHKAHARASTLSGGEKQRVAIARAISHKPSILLCDEPTGALDSENTLHVVALLKEIALHDVAVIVVTHDGDVASQTHRAVQLRGGRLTAA